MSSLESHKVRWVLWRNRRIPYNSIEFAWTPAIIREMPKLIQFNVAGLKDSCIGTETPRSAIFRSTLNCLHEQIRESPGEIQSVDQPGFLVVSWLHSRWVQITIATSRQQTNTQFLDAVYYPLVNIQKAMENHYVQRKELTMSG